MQINTKKRVGILRGGTGRHYASSIKKGGEIIAYIFENLSDKYKPIDILVDKDYIWHCGGVPINPGDLVYQIDVVWNLSHPSFSNILESLSIPNIKSNPFLATLMNDRKMFQEYVKDIGIIMPRSVVNPKNAREVFEKFGAPWIVKSFALDSNMGIHLAKTFPELVDNIEDGVKHGQSILVEEFISGKVASLHSVPDFRGEDFYIFPPVNVFGDFSLEEKEKLIFLTKNLHKHIGEKHYLKSDFLLNKRGKVYLLDLDFTPNLKSHSHFSQACESVDAKMHHVVEHILEQAFNN